MIPIATEKYMAFMWGKKLVSIESIQFRNSSLKNLLKNLYEDKFKYSQKHYGDQLQVLKQKEIYPYKYMNSFERLHKTKLLCKRETSIARWKMSILMLEVMSMLGKLGFTWNKEYRRCSWFLFKEWYFFSGCFWWVKNKCLKYFKLDPSHYFSSPGWR